MFVCVCMSVCLCVCEREREMKAVNVFVSKYLPIVVEGVASLEFVTSTAIKFVLCVQSPKMAGVNKRLFYGVNILLTVSERVTFA